MQGGDPSTLKPVDAQPYTARLAGAAALRTELEAVFGASDASAEAADYRRLIIKDNAAGKRSASARNWIWLRLKLRYALDRPRSAEFQAFRTAMDATTAPAERGILCGLMVARNDRMLRDLATELISPHLTTGGALLQRDDVIAGVEERRAGGGFEWSPKSVRSMALHFMTSAKEFGWVAGHRTLKIQRIVPGAEASAFAATLGKLEGLSDRQVLDGRWFQVMGCDSARAAECLAAAARKGRVRFRMQADVVELDLTRPDDAGASS